MNFILDPGKVFIPKIHCDYVQKNNTQTVFWTHFEKKHVLRHQKNNTQKTQPGDSAVLVTFLCPLLGGHLSNNLSKKDHKKHDPETLNNQFWMHVWWFPTNFPCKDLVHPIQLKQGHQPPQCLPWEYPNFPTHTTFHTTQLHLGDQLHGQKLRQLLWIEIIQLHLNFGAAANEWPGFCEEISDSKIMRLEKKAEKCFEEGRKEI